MDELEHQEEILLKFLLVSIGLLASGHADVSHLLGAEKWLKIRGRLQEELKKLADEL